MCVCAHARVRACECVGGTEFWCEKRKLKQRRTQRLSEVGSNALAFEHSLVSDIPLEPFFAAHGGPDFPEHQ